MLPSRDPKRRGNQDTAEYEASKGDAANEYDNIQGKKGMQYSDTGLYDNTGDQRKDTYIYCTSLIM